MWSYGTTKRRSGQDHKGDEWMKRRTGRKECFLYREEEGFGWEKQRVWMYGNFKYAELKQLLREGWIEDKKVKGNRKATA